MREKRKPKKGSKCKQRIIIIDGDKWECKNLTQDLHEFEQINKARLSVGLSPLKLKLVKCLRCDKKIYTIGRYRCLICDEHINKFNIYEDY
nr:hypothetical protein GTC16762_33810 [Pigmentibacter ruber]